MKYPHPTTWQDHPKLKIHDNRPTNQRISQIFASITGMNSVYTSGQISTRLIIRLGLWSVFALINIGLCHATEPPNLKQSSITGPDQITGVKTLFADDVIMLAMEKPGLIIVDARIADDRRHGYLENSLSLPDIETNCDSLEQLIPSKSSPVMFYCNGVRCGRSVVSIKIARSCGYENLYWFKGGFEEWRMKGYQFSKDR